MSNNYLIFVGLLFVNLLGLEYSLAANLLFISGVPSPSHFIWNRAIINELASKGHNVTVLTTDLDKSPAKQNVKYFHLEEVYKTIYADQEDFNFLEIGQLNPLLNTLVFGDVGYKSCEGSLKSKGFLDLMAYPDNFKFDAVLYDYLIGPCLLVLVDKFNSPPLISLTAYITPSSTSIFGGSMFYPSFIPYTLGQYDDKMSLTERIINTIYYLFEHSYRQVIATPKLDKLVRSKYPNMTYLGDLEQRSQISLLNSNPVIDYVEPVLPNVIPVGGLQIQAPKTLPEDFQKIYDNAPNGVILFSLGTNMRSDHLGTERLKNLLTAFTNVPQYEIIWKFESTNLPIDIPKNVHIKNWVPQSDILANPRTILFITHNGMLSTQEAIWYGVPMIGFPIFGDQFQNINRCVKFGFAKRLSILEFSADELKGAILEVLMDPSYRKNIAERSDIFRYQPQPPLDRAIWWIEWVLRYPKNQSLQSPSMKLGILTRHSVDVIVILAGELLIVLVIFLSIIKCCLSRCVKKKKTDKIKKN